MASARAGPRVAKELLARREMRQRPQQPDCDDCADRTVCGAPQDNADEPWLPRKVPMRVPENPVLSPVRAGLSFVRVGLPATISRDWTGTLMIYIAVFVAGMIMTIAVLSLLAASIRYALDHDRPH
jgi:hypothetical protein